jgi:ADP-glucose pyrophosphorylase
VKNSLISNGCRISGGVSRSILSSGVEVQKGAEVADSIILPDAIIEKGVNLQRVIVDAAVRVTKKKAEEVEKARGKNKNAIIVVGKRKIQNENEIEG